jgi:AcrR family transcriptional regulator
MPDRLEVDRPPATSDRVLRATAELLSTGGVEAVSTRAVAAAAGVQPPVIYRQFGDKEGLLDAVTHYLLVGYMEEKRKIFATSDDPIEALRQSWDLHVEFGLANPHAYVLAYGTPRQGKVATASKETVGLLREQISRIGEEGRLGMSVERATNLVHAAGLGTVLSLIPVPQTERDLQLLVIARENALSAILNTTIKKTSRGTATLSARAVALAEAIRSGDVIPMTSAERGLLVEWLDRLADDRTDPTGPLLN